MKIKQKSPSNPLLMRAIRAIHSTFKGGSRARGTQTDPKREQSRVMGLWKVTTRFELNARALLTKGYGPLLSELHLIYEHYRNPDY